MNELNKNLFSHRKGRIDESFSDTPHTSLFPVADIYQAAQWIKAEPFQTTLKQHSNTALKIFQAGVVCPGLNHRIMESFGLGGILEIISFHPLAMDKKPSTRPGC